MQWFGNRFKAGVLYSRAGIATQIILSAANNFFLVDAGDGTLRDLLNQTIDMSRISGIFLTHGHHDHVSGLFALLAHFRNMKRKKTIQVIFPKGILTVPQIIQAFQNSFSDIPFLIQIQQIRAGDRIRLLGLGMQAYGMTHYAAVGVHELLHQDIALGYRFYYHGESIAITGDTALCNELEELVRGADLAFIDSTLKKDEVTEERLHKLHLSRGKAREIGRLAGKYIPIHLSFSKK